MLRSFVGAAAMTCQCTAADTHTHTRTRTHLLEYCNRMRVCCGVDHRDNTCLFDAEARTHVVVSTRGCEPGCLCALEWF